MLFFNLNSFLNQWVINVLDILFTHWKENAFIVLTPCICISYHYAFFVSVLDYPSDIYDAEEKQSALCWIPGVMPRNYEISVSDSVHSLSSRYYFKFPNNICQQVWPSDIWSKIYLYPLCDYMVYHWLNCCTSFWSSLCFQRHCGKY